MPTDRTRIRLRLIPAVAQGNCPRCSWRFTASPATAPKTGDKITCANCGFDLRVERN